jgi:hypothetical protein
MVPLRTNSASAGSAWAGSAWADRSWAGPGWIGSGWIGSGWIGSGWIGSGWIGSAAVPAVLGPVAPVGPLAGFSAGAGFSGAESDLGLLNQSDHSYWLFSERSIDWYCSPAATGSLLGPDRPSLRRPRLPCDADL